jgi:ABC-type cobalamin/Fe3+-siderophores transport system ATPase subunit
MRLEGHDLVLSYGGATVVNNVTIKLPDKKVSVIIGPNGSGKSTVLRALSRLLKPKTGNVVLDGHAIHSMNAKEIARKMAILPQIVIAPEAITVENLVWYGRHPHRRGVAPPGAEDRRVVDWAIRVTNLDKIRDHPVDQLSGGQRQRAWIALSLAQGTDIILLDEPTTYLDLAYQLEVLELLSQLNRKEGKTVAMVLHDLQLAAEFADYVFVVREGILYAEGSPVEVFTSEMMRQVFGVETHLLYHPVTHKPLCVPLRASTDDLPEGGHHVKLAEAPNAALAN